MPNPARPSPWSGMRLANLARLRSSTVGPRRLASGGARAKPSAAAQSSTQAWISCNCPCASEGEARWQGARGARNLSYAGCGDIGTYDANHGYCSYYVPFSANVHHQLGGISWVVSVGRCPCRPAILHDRACRASPRVATTSDPLKTGLPHPVRDGGQSRLRAALHHPYGTRPAAAAATGCAPF